MGWTIVGLLRTSYITALSWLDTLMHQTDMKGLYLASIAIVLGIRWLTSPLTFSASSDQAPKQNKNRRVRANNKDKGLRRS